MINKKLIIFAILLVTLLTVSAVSATDNTTSSIVNVKENNNNALSIIVEPNFELGEFENEKLSYANDEGSFTDLYNEINDTVDELNLTRDYFFDSTKDSNTRDSYYGTTLTSGIYIKKPITINGNGHSIFADHKLKGFIIKAENVTLNNINFYDCKSNSAYGSITWEGNNGALLNCTFVECTASNGGAVYWTGGNGTISNCIFEKCSSTYGSAIYLKNAQNIDIHHCNFINNNAIYHGVAYLSNSKVTFDNCVFDNNVGGAIYHNENNAICIINHSKFINNANRAIYWYGNDLQIDYSIFINNSYAPSRSFTQYTPINGDDDTLNSKGGAAYIEGDRTIISNSIFNNNKVSSSIRSSVDFFKDSSTGMNLFFNIQESLYANSYGGALYLKGNNFYLNNLSCEKNLAYSSVYVSMEFNTYERDWRFHQYTYANNYGGALYLNGRGILSNSYISENKLTGNAGVYKGILPDRIISTKSEVTNNGAGVYWIGYSRNNLVNNTIFIQNKPTSGKSGSALFLNNFKGDVRYNTFLENPEKIIGSSGESEFTADYNWWGNTASNYNQALIADELGVTKWFFLNLYSNNSNLEIGESTFVMADLSNVYDSSSNNIQHEYGLNNIELNLISNKVKTNDSNVIINNGVAKTLVTAQNYGQGSLTASFYNINSVLPLYISKKFSDVTVQINNCTIYNEELIVYLNITPNATGLIKLYLNNEDYSTINLIKDGNNNLNINLTGLTPNNYTLQVVYNGDDIYYPSNTTAKFIINKLNSELTAKDIITTYDSDKNLVATLTDANGEAINDELNVTLDGEDYTIRTESNGQANIPIGNLTPGTYTATISYKGSNNYNPTSTAAKITVTKADTIISASDVSVAYKDSNGGIVTIITNEHGKPLNVSLNINLDGKTYAVITDSNGQANIPIGNILPGAYTATISYKGSSNYKASSTTARVTVNKLTSVVSADDVTVYYGDTKSKLIATLTNADGIPLSANIVITLNGVDYAMKTNSKGQASVSTASLNPGVHITTIIYKGNSKYNPSSATAKVTVNNKFYSFVSADDVAVNYGDTNGKFVATLTNAEGVPLSANIVINLNGVDYAMKTNSKGQGSVSTKDLAPGTYTATITYKGNSKYSPSSTTAKVTVTNKLVSVVSAEDVTVRCGDSNGKLIATLTNAEGIPLSANIVISLNGVDYAMKTNSKGRASVSTDDLAPGEYTATVTYKGNSKYNPSSTTAKVTVINKLTSVVSADDVAVNYGDTNGKFVATLTNAEGVPLSANIVININGVDYTLKTNSKGRASVSTAKLNVGEYTATVTYKGNSKYAPSTTTAKVTVTNKLVSVVSAEDITVNYGAANGKLIATLTNAAGVPLSANIVINLNGVNYAMKTNSKGQASVSTADLAVGEYTAYITYKGNSKYAPSTTTAKITVNNNLDTYISVVYNVGSKELVATLTDADGNTVEGVAVVFNIDGMDYELNTDFNGEAKFSTKYFEPGSYIINVSYGGNSKYNPTSKSSKVIIQ